MAVAMAEERVMVVAERSKHIDVCGLMINVVNGMMRLGNCYCIRL